MHRRELNSRGVEDYIRRVLTGESATWRSEELAPDESARETAAVQLRRSAGIARTGFRFQTDCDLDAMTGGRIACFVAEGLLADDGESVRLTRRGRCVADTLIVKLVWE